MDGSSNPGPRPSCSTRTTSSCASFSRARRAGRSAWNNARRRMRPLVYHGGFAAYAVYAGVGAWALGELVLQVATRADEGRDPSYAWMIPGSALGVALALGA